MKRIHSIALCAFLLVAVRGIVRSADAEALVLSGRLTDGETGLPVAGAHLVVRETGRMTASDSTGSFVIPLPRAGRYTLTVRHVAYVMVERSILVPRDAPMPVHISLTRGTVQAEEVVVRSTRVSGSQASTPFPVAVPGAAEMSRPAMPTVPDALAMVPGIALARDGSWETSLSVRGMGRTGVVTMVDDARIETSTDLAGPLSLIALHDLERVEVVKGPASSLDGTGALGGSVHFISKRPAFTDHPQLGGQYIADVASVNGAAGQYLALEGGAGPVAARLSGGRRIARNTRTPGGPLENSGYTDFSLSGALGVELFAGHALFVNYQRVQGEDAGIPGGAAIAAPARATYTLARRELLAVEYRAANVSSFLPLLTFRAAHQQIARNVEIIQSPALTLTPHAVHTTKSAQTEVRLLPAAHLLVTAGAEVWQRALESWRERRQVLAGVITGERPLPMSRFLSAGVFAQGEWEIDPDHVTATFGARHDWIRVQNDEVWSPEYVISAGVKQDPAPGSRMLWGARSARDASWSANAGVVYSPFAGVDVTALCATAFRSPSLEERYDFIDLGTYVRLGNPDLHAEQSVSVNTGVRFTGAGLRAQADCFLNGLTDMVAELPGTFEGRRAYIRANIGRARLYGYEVSLEQRPVRWGTVAVTLASVRGEDLVHHTALPQIPPWSGTVMLGGTLPGAGSITLTAAWAARQGTPGGDETATPGYVVLDADLAAAPLEIAGTSFALRAGVRNIFDRDYRLHLSTLRGVVRSEPGRNLVIAASVTF
ncbi:MAG: TonB-dependent receptor [Ignavibacteriae bacterium]|nr:TonB-dependent receptor [Ignavibacteriota bacterium]